MHQATDIDGTSNMLCTITTRSSKILKSDMHKKKKKKKLKCVIPNSSSYDINNQAFKNLKEKKTKNKKLKPL
jgi:hypothetical protein